METALSAEYFRRRQMLASLDVPTISEAKEHAGLKLSMILFEQCHQDLKVDFGLLPYLNGPSGNLWVSPSDLLIGKVALKPPLTQKHIQALTHEGIIALGSEVEQKFLNEMRLEKEKALQEREAYLTKMFEAKKLEITEEIRLEEKRKYEKQMEELRNYFENKICELLCECYEQVKALEEQMQIEIDSLNVLWQEKLEQEIQETVSRITQEFLEKLGLQEQLLVSIFTKQIKQLKSKKKAAIDFERTKCKEKLIQMKHQLHCQNISNLMYLLCKERRKCKAQKEKIECEYSCEIRKLKSTIRDKNKIIRNLTKIKEKKTKQLEVRERCLKEILRQFQKFIYFALKATPTQGEFLLNIDKLIRYELDDRCLPKIPEIQEKAISEIPVIYPEIREEEFFELILEPEEEEAVPSDALPSFYFNDKLYIREDFRDMIDAGVDLNQEHPLWNPDAEELIKIFKQRIEEKENDSQIVKLKSHCSSVRFDKTDGSGGSLSAQLQTVLPDHTPPPSLAISSPSAGYKTSPAKLPPPKPTTEVPKKSLSNAVPQGLNKKISYEQSSEREMKKVGLKQEVDAAERSDTDEITLNREVRRGSGTQSKLTLARDSIILHISAKERKSLQLVSRATEESMSRAESEKESVSKIESERGSVVAKFGSERGSVVAKVESERESVVAKVGSERGSVVKESIPKTADKEESQESLSKSNVEKEKRDDVTEDTTSKTGSEREKFIKVIDKTDKDYESTAMSLEPESRSYRSQESIKSGSRPTSKLLLATDSFELIKRSAIKLLSKDKKCTDVKKKAEKTKVTEKQKGKKPSVTATSTSKSPKKVAKVVGSRKMKEQDKPTDEFTEERIRSLVNVMKDNPSLLRLFTPCFK